MTATGSKQRPGLSLATRIFLVTALLVALAVGTAVAVTAWKLQKLANDAVEAALERSSSAQANLQELRQDQLKLVSNLFADDPYLAAYVAEAAGQLDVRSILDLLAERRSSMSARMRDPGFDFVLVLDPAGRLIARTDQPGAAGQDLSGLPLVARALAESAEAAGFVQEGEKLYYSVAVPLKKDDFTLLGFLVTAFAIDEDTAREVRRISGADVAFVAMNDGEPRVVTSTLEPETADSLVAALRDQQRMMGRVMEAGQPVPRADLEVRGEPWRALLAPLLDPAGKPLGMSVALASLDRERELYQEVQAYLLGAGLLAVLVAFPLSYLLAQRTLAPVRRLVVAAEAARQGDYSRRIAAGRGDEVGQLARSFDVLLADLREKRDMEAYVSELSRNLPEPAPAGRAVVGTPQAREVALLGIELRGYVRADGPEATLERLAADLRVVAAAVAAARGQIEAVAGHRVLARFEGEGRTLRALAAAAEVLRRKAGEEDEAPLAALASGRAVAGPVAWAEAAEKALVGLPVQQIESLLREATAGEVVLSRNAHQELQGALAAAGYVLAPRRGVVSPQPFYVLSAEMAGRLAASSGAGATPAGPGAAATFSGIEPGALMAQRFEILSVLGAGGMGVVYKARDRELDDLVALKMLKRELGSDRGHLERLKTELKLARRITHPNVLRTFDFGEVDGIPYISMEYVRGVTLRYLLDQTKRLPYSAGLRLAKQLCGGLAAAHAVGVLHRDIKPENLILEPTGNAKLMDFGIARPITRVEPGQTQAGWLVGTPQYLSPEQLQGKEPDERADIYSCGIVLYEIFTGGLPWAAASGMDLLLKHLNEPPAPPSARWPEIPPELERIILRCLAKDPDERYPKVQELLEDLEKLSA